MKHVFSMKNICRPRHEDPHIFIFKDRIVTMKCNSHLISSSDAGSTYCSVPLLCVKQRLVQMLCFCVSGNYQYCYCASFKRKSIKLKIRRAGRSSDEGGVA